MNTGQMNIDKCLVILKEKPQALSGETGSEFLSHLSITIEPKHWTRRPKYLNEEHHLEKFAPEECSQLR